MSLFEVQSIVDVLIMLFLLQNFSVSLIKGFIDSLRGVTVLLYLDKEINERALSRSPNLDPDNPKNREKQPKVKQLVFLSYYSGIFFVFTC